MLAIASGSTGTYRMPHPDSGRVVSDSAIRTRVERVRVREERHFDRVPGGPNGAVSDARIGQGDTRSGGIPELCVLAGSYRQC